MICWRVKRSQWRKLLERGRVGSRYVRRLLRASVPGPGNLSRRSPQVTSHPSSPPQALAERIDSLCSGPRKQKAVGITS